MVEKLEDTFRAEVRENVVEHGECVEKNQGGSENSAASDIFRGSDLRGENAHERQPDDAEDEADEMGDAVGPLLAAAAMELLQAHLKPAVMLGEVLFFLVWSGVRHFCLFNTELQSFYTQSHGVVSEQAVDFAGIDIDVDAAEAWIGTRSGH